MITFDHLSDDDLAAAALSLRLPPDVFTPKLLAYLSAHVDDSTGPTGCWPWTGDRQGAHYGVVGVRGADRRTTRGAHRLIHVLANGPLSDPKLLVLHSCPGGDDHPWCVNPAHLREGSHRDNAADAVARGRARTRVLDPEDRDFIPGLIDRLARASARRGRPKTRPELFAAYAASFGVTPGRMGAIYDEARRRVSAAAPAASTTASEGEVETSPSAR